MCALAACTLLVSVASGADVDGRADWRRAGTALVRSAAPPPTGTPSRDASPPAVASPPSAAPVPSDALPRGNAPPVLGGIGRQDLIGGRTWRLHVRVRDPDGDASTLRVRGLPDGARVVDEGRGWHRLEWTPPIGASGSRDLTLVAVDARDERLRSERVVRLELRSPVRHELGPLSVEEATIGHDELLELGEGDGSSGVERDSVSGTGFDPGPNVGPGGSPTSGTAPDAIASLPSSIAAPAARASAPRPLAPVIAPLASQIVSAGRTVSFRVAATLDEPSRAPLLQIDRLPRNASFDENPDGSRTFHWPTGDRDQGEHRFRISALHPDDESLRSRVHLLVIVGDPSRASTVPLDEGGPFPEAAFDEPFERKTESVPIDGERFEGPEVEDEPFLPDAGPPDADYWSDADEAVDGYFGDPYGGGVDAPSPEPDDPLFEPTEPGYFDDLPLGPDGLPFEP